MTANEQNGRIARSRNVEMKHTFRWIVCSLAVTWANSGGIADDRTIEFDRDVRPILSAHCFLCHGPDKDTREADLRLDAKAGFFGSATNGHPIVEANAPDKSELYRRITSANHDEQMPPKDGGKPLTEAQIATLKRWIEQGAKWRGHWAYEPIVRPPVPLDDDEWADNPIDCFLRQRWKAANVEPAEGGGGSLWRQLNLDLTGLIPIDVQAASSSGTIGWCDGDGYASSVDRLLDSPAFGERMAVYWLDLVRYGDSCGYHSDVDQQISPYRDYVIGAFNRNLPFDQFTREQLAGDLLPNPTLDQRIATGFNRLSKATEEGGAQEGEYLAKALADRVRTVSGTWLAATLGCAECHDHKYDPLTTRDFYSLGAFFADVKERGVYGAGRHEPELSLPTDEQARQLADLDARLTELRDRLKAAEGNDEAKTDLDNELKRVDKQRKDFENGIRRTLVTVSVTPREIRILPRGDWLNNTGDLVQPAVPGIFSSQSDSSKRLTRLDLADWLVARNNPLTARVFVNRMWKLFFGAGLTRSLEDIGSQGEPPDHPELLDWLAAEFMDSGWNVKHLVRLIVTSHAYRLSSVPTPELLKADPQNRLFARQSRWRLDAEFLRDNALHVSNLLVDRIGGPSVKPYQPEGYWEFLNFPKRTWQASTGSDQYRRGLYTHWQRTFLHPAMLAFDASSREECAASRPTSNTPKSALALLNDPSFVEAAVRFAQRIRRQGGETDQDKVTWAWRLALTRSPDEHETDSLLKLLTQSRNQNGPVDSATLAKIGQTTLDPNDNPVEVAAWTSVARAILNLHEFNTRN